MAYVSLALTETENSKAFKLSERTVVKVYTEGTGAGVQYVQPYDGKRTTVIVDETPTAITTAATTLFAVTVDGNSIRLSTERYLMCETVNSQTVIWYDANGASAERIIVSETEAAVQAAINAL